MVSFKKFKTCYSYSNYKSILLVLITFILIILAYFTFFPEPDYLRFVEYTQTYNSSHIFDLELNYVIGNNCTKNGAIRIIQVVTSYAGNVEARSALRRSYPQNELADLGMYRVFLLGMLKPQVISLVTQNAILNENERYNDIVQGNFFEAYRNLTYKHVMGIRWAVTKCDVEYIVKMDDDIVVDIYSLIALVQGKTGVNYDAMGYVFDNMKPIRLEANKWYVTEEEFGMDTYPTFVSGWLYVIKSDSAKNLLRILKSERYFWIDDVFVTGVLAQKADFKFENISKYFTTNPEYFECCMRDRVECGFIVGPSGGDYNINIDFQRHSKMCHNKNCTKYTNGKTFRNSCVVSRKIPSIGKGFAALDVIKL